MLTPSHPSFTLQQHAYLGASATLLISAALMSRVETANTELAEVVELYRPRDPNLALWQLSATEGAPVAVCELPSGDEWRAPSIEAALAWVVAVERGELEGCIGVPACYVGP